MTLSHEFEILTIITLSWLVFYDKIIEMCLVKNIKIKINVSLK